MSDSLELLVIITIVCMAAVTYLTRAGGLFIVSRINPSPGIRAFLTHMPSSILVAIIVPSLAGKGPSEMIAAGVTAIMAVCTRNLVLSLAAGLLTVSLLRHYLFVQP